jgi:hypothetical protein
MKKNKIIYKSDCCYAPIRIEGGVTKFAVCTECNQSCDVTLKPRRGWHRSPVTQVCPNKKKQKIERQVKKEINE